MNENFTDNKSEFEEQCSGLFSEYEDRSEEIRDMCFDVLAIPDRDARQAHIDIMLSSAKKCKVLTRFKKDFEGYKRECNNMKIAEMADGTAHLSSYPEGYELICNGYEIGTNYIVNNTGIYKVVETKAGDIKKIMICSQPLLIVSRYRNLHEQFEKVVLAYIIGDKWHCEIAERETISSNAKIVRLANSSLDVTSETARDIVRYLQYIMQLNADRIPIVNTVSRLGWHNSEFIPYSDIIKCDTEDSFKDILRQLTSKGSFDMWRKHCAELRQNIYLRLTMAASFAAPLIEIIGGLPFVVHLWGATGTGKTVALCIAASVWGRGSYMDNALIQSFKGTEYALSEKAAFLYSLPVIIDEGQTVKDKTEFDTLIMNLTEGKGKIQGAASGGIKKLRHWANCFITTAEENIIKSDSGGGTSNRVISIAVGNTKVIADGNYTVQLIGANYGFAGQAYIKYIQSISVENLRTAYSRIYRQIIDEIDSTEKQCAAMAILMLADTLAGQCIFRDEKPLSMADVKPFLTSKNEVDNAARAYEWLVDWIAQNVKHFTADAFSNAEIWGKLDDDNRIAVINRKVIMEHLRQAGYAYEAVMPELARRGKLALTQQGKWLQWASISGIRASYVKLYLEADESGFIEIDKPEDVPEQFTQECLPF